jgi:glycosyltransferase involved in cell wall biosynthesis
MIIGFDAKRVFNNGTGLGNYGRTLLQNLIQHAEDEIHLFSPKIKSEYQHQFSTQQVQVHTNSNEYLADAIWRSIFIPSLTISKKLQIYHGLSAELPFIKFAKAKRVVTVHDLIYLTFPKDHSRFDRWIYYQKKKHALDAADLVIATSEHTKNDILNTFKMDESKIRVHYQSCDPVFFEANYTQKPLHPRPYFLYLGSIRPRKNLFTIVKALHELKQQGYDADIMIFGQGGEYKKEVLAYAKEKKLTQHLIFMPYTPNAELKSYLHQSQALIYPSLYEGFGIPIIEGFLCKTPVIASKRSSLSEIGGNCAHFLDDPLNPDEMAHLMKLALNNELMTEVDKQNALQYAREKFGGIPSTQKLLDLYSTII